MATFTPANQLLLKIPKAPTDSVIKKDHPVNNWVESVGEQISTYKASASRSFLPQVAPSLKHDKSEQGLEIMRNKQFSTLNCEPYQRENRTNFGVCK